jgi:hypothetical protein
LNASKIDPEIWASSTNNTNAAEAAHALANREGKQLKLLTAIIRFFEFILEVYLFDFLFIFNNIMLLEVEKLIKKH